MTFNFFRVQRVICLDKNQQPLRKTRCNRANDTLEQRTVLLRGRENCVKLTEITFGEDDSRQMEISRKKIMLRLKMTMDAYCAQLNEMVITGGP